MLKKSVLLKTLPIGEPIAQNIFDEHDRLLLRQGSILTPEFIQRLESNNIDSVYIVMDIATNQESRPNKDENKSKPIFKSVPANFYTFYNELLYEQDRIELRGYYKKPIQKEFLNQVNAFIELLTRDPDTSLQFFLDIKKSQNKYKYNEHHINTGIMAILISKWLNFDSNLTKEIAITSMLHDIGETRIPSKILKKPGTLTKDEREIIETHPTIGVQILNKTDWINNRELYGVLTHHERLNGQGYPYKLLGSKITIHARVTAVASILNVATTDRPYARAKNILEVLLEIRNRSYGELDSKVARVLYENIIDFLHRNRKTILLNNGDKGHLLKGHKQELKLIINGERGVYDLDDVKSPRVVNIS
ncbi:MAG: HD domain-containing protein [Syntrophomonadaceae bacterium]|nr:HD domain-containing protein [Syntrophomonadaceae bacterium]